MPAAAEDKVKLSAILPVTLSEIDIEAIFLQYARQLDELAEPYEFLFLIDGDSEKFFERLKQLKEAHPQIKIVRFSNKVDTSVALAAGFEKTEGEKIVILSLYPQIEPSGLVKLLQALDEASDMVIAHRFPRRGSLFNRLRSFVFNWLIAKMTNTSFHDLGCSVRVFKRKVITEISLYGNLHRFLPILALKKGFKVKELQVGQHEDDMNLRSQEIGTYGKELLGVLNLFFLLNFTRKPLRFFGFIGSVMFGLGFLINFYLGLMRWLEKTPLANRPLLLLGVLLVVLGVQTISIGLIGEIIIFTHAKGVKEYNIEQILM